MALRGLGERYHFAVLAIPWPALLMHLCLHRRVSAAPNSVESHQ
jgi:hypothetical protein